MNNVNKNIKSKNEKIMHTTTLYSLFVTLKAFILKIFYPHNPIVIAEISTKKKIPFWMRHRFVIKNKNKVLKKTHLFLNCQKTPSLCFVLFV